MRSVGARTSRRDSHGTDIGAEIVDELVELALSSGGCADRQIPAFFRENDGDPFARFDDPFHEDDVTRRDANSANDEAFTDERLRGRHSTSPNLRASEGVVRVSFCARAFFAKSLLHELDELVGVGLERRAGDTRARQKHVGR